MEYEINSITGTERSEDRPVATLHTAGCRLRVSGTCSMPAPTLVQGRAPRRHALPFSPWSLASQRTFSERMDQGASTGHYWRKPYRADALGFGAVVGKRYQHRMELFRTLLFRTSPCRRRREVRKSTPFQRRTRLPIQITGETIRYSMVRIAAFCQMFPASDHCSLGSIKLFCI